MYTETNNNVIFASSMFTLVMGLVRETIDDNNINNMTGYFTPWPCACTRGNLGIKTLVVKHNIINSCVELYSCEIYTVLSVVNTIMGRYNTTCMELTACIDLSPAMMYMSWKYRFSNDNYHTSMVACFLTAQKFSLPKER